jgi:hypothetical protein
MGDGGLAIATDLLDASPRIASTDIQAVESFTAPIDGARRFAGPAGGTPLSAMSVTDRTQAGVDSRTSADVASAATDTNESSDRSAVSSFQLTNASPTTYAAPVQRQGLGASTPQVDAAPPTPAVSTDDREAAFSPFDLRDLTTSSAAASGQVRDAATPSPSTEVQASTWRASSVRDTSEVSQFDLRSVASPPSSASPQPSATIDRAPSSDDSSSASRADVGHDARADSWRGASTISQFDLRSAASVAAPASPQPSTTIARAPSSDDSSSTSRADGGRDARADSWRGASTISQFDLRSAASVAGPASPQPSTTIARALSSDDSSSTSRADGGSDARADSWRGASTISQFDLRSAASVAAPASPQSPTTIDRAPSSDDSASTSRSDGGRDARADSWRGASMISQFDLRSAASTAAPASPQPSTAIDRAESSDDRSSALRADAAWAQGELPQFDLRRSVSSAPSTSVRPTDFVSGAPQSDAVFRTPQAAAGAERSIASFDQRSASASGTQRRDFGAPASQYDAARSTAYVTGGRDGAAPTPFDTGYASDATNAAPQRRASAGPAVLGTRADEDAQSALVSESRGRQSATSIAASPAFAPTTSTDLEQTSAGAGIADPASTPSIVVDRGSAPPTAAPSTRRPAVVSAVSDQIARSNSTAADLVSANDGWSPALSQQDSSSAVATQTANGWRPQAHVADSGAEPPSAAIVVEPRPSQETMRQPQARAVSQIASPATTVAVDAMPRTADVAFAAADAAPVVAASTRARTVAPGSADRASSNDRRAFADEAATSLDSFADVAAPLAGARGAQDPSSSGEGGFDHRAFAETTGRSTASVDIKPSAFDVQGGVSAPAEASLAPADVSTIGATSSDARVDEASTSASAPESIGTLAILASPTQLPAAFAELLAPQARSLLASASAPVETTAAARGAPVADTQRQSVAPKILTIELEPASLGAVVVKMKLGHSGIDMRISVESTEALRRLDSTRDQLVEAMQSSGCSVDSCTIQIGQNTGDGGNAQAASDGGAAYAQSSGAGAGRDEQSVGRQGAGYGGQGGDRRRGAGGEAAEPGSNGDNRRVADRRGGDLYL